MGKLKVTKTKKNKRSKGTSGIPNWLLSTLVILVVVAVIFTCVSTFVASNGVEMRVRSAMSLNEHKVSGNMMAYFSQTTYQNFLNNYQSYLSYLSIDTDVESFADLKNQPFNPEGSYDSAFLGEFDGSWYDYFMSQTKTSVENLLLYVAEADKLGVELTQKDKDDIETEIDAIVSEMQYYYAGASEDTCLATLYGKGVKRTDVRKAMELSVLASKTAQKISDDIEASLTDERINSTYAANQKEFLLVDYYGYSFSVYYSDVVAEKYPSKKAADLTADEKAAVLALYQEKITAARNAASVLATKNNLDDFRAYVVEYEANDLFETEYDSAISKLTSTDKPSELNIKQINDKILAAVIAEINGGKTTVTDDVVVVEAGGTKYYSMYGISLTAEYAKAMQTFKSSLFTKVLSAKEDNLMDKVNYIAPDSKGVKDDFSEWAFAERSVNDTKVFEEGDGANSAAFASTLTESFCADVCIMVRPSYRDETLSRNIAYMLFTKEETAIKAIDALDATQGLNKDKFMELAKASTTAADAYQYLEDCIIGTMQDEAFDDWAFNAYSGSYTTKPIKLSDGSFMVAFLHCETDIPAWTHSVKAYIYNNDYTAKETAMTEQYASAIVTNDKLIARIGG